MERGKRGEDRTGERGWRRRSKTQPSTHSFTVAYLYFTFPSLLLTLSESPSGLGTRDWSRRFSVSFVIPILNSADTHTHPPTYTHPHTHTHTHTPTHPHPPTHPPTHTHTPHPPLTHLLSDFISLAAKAVLWAGDFHQPSWEEGEIWWVLKPSLL